MSAMPRAKPSPPALAEDLAGLEGLPKEELRDRWAELYGGEPPKRMAHDLLCRCIAYRLQEQALGGLRPATRRRLLKLAGQVEKGLEMPLPTARRVTSGARLFREWRGEMHRVTVLENGFEYRDRRYRSLSVIARQITGTRWSGPRFFGLREAPRTGGPDHAG